MRSRPSAARSEPRYRRPSVELVEAYLAQHDAEPATIEKLHWLLGKAVDSFGDLRVDELRSQETAAWRLATPPDANLYAYVRDDPINFIDPSGLRFGVPRIGLPEIRVPGLLRDIGNGFKDVVEEGADVVEDSASIGWDGVEWVADCASGRLAARGGYQRGCIGGITTGEVVAVGGGRVGGGAACFGCHSHGATAYPICRAAHDGSSSGGGVCRRRRRSGNYRCQPGAKRNGLV